MKPDEYRTLLKQSPLERQLAAQLDLEEIAYDREFYFAKPERNFRADFCLRHFKILIECEGQLYKKGGHTSSTGIIRDMEKANLAQLLGYRIFRFDKYMIQDGAALRTIQRAIGIGANKGPKPGHAR